MTPEVRRRLPVEAMVCSVLAVVVFLSFDLWRPFNMGDEAFRYLLSRSWARGENLFDRFLVLYPTGSYAFYGSLMRMLGEDLWVLRLARAVLGGAAVFSLFVTLRRRDASALPWALALAIAASSGASEKLLASTLVLCAVVTLIDTDSPDRRWLVLSALAAGILAGWREDSAVLMAGVALLWVWRRRRPVEVLTVVIPAVAAGFAFWVLIESARGDAVSFVQHVAQRLAFLFERFADRTDVPWTLPPGRLPQSPLELGRLAMPVLAAVPAVTYATLLATQFVRWRRDLDSQPLVIASALGGFAYLPQFLWERPDFSHFIAHLPVLLTVVAFAASTGSSTTRRRVAAVLLVVGVASAGAKILQARTVEVVPYPTEIARDIGIGFRGSPPKWADLPRLPGETLIVLGWSAGWYVVEGIDPGTRFLSTFSRHLPTESERAELDRDLEDPQNRWVIKAQFAEGSDSYLPVLPPSYELIGRWRRQEVWERMDGKSQEPTKPAFRDGFEVGDTSSWSPTP